MPRFAGSDYVPTRDDRRLTTQHERVKALMLDGQWRTLNEIADTTHDPQPSILAQLGHLRKARFGGWTVEKQLRSERAQGLYEYRVVPGSGTF